MTARAWLDDARFVAACMAVSFAAGWFWSLAEWWMRVDVHV